MLTGIIFRGSEKQITDDEKESWYPGVDFYILQDNAWADAKMSVQWVKKTVIRIPRGGTAIPRTIFLQKRGRFCPHTGREKRTLS